MTPPPSPAADSRPPLRLATRVVLLGLALALPATAAEEPQPAPALSTAAAPGTQALDLKLPKPLFVGTPKNIKSTNLEKPLAGKRPVYQVPAGTALLSAGKRSPAVIKPR